MIAARPLATLAPERVRALIAALRPALGPSTATTLATSRDPDVFAVGWGDGDAWAPTGVFALRPLRADPLGLRLARRIGGGAQARFPGPHGLAAAIGVRPGPTSTATMRAILAAIGHRSLGRMYGRVFFHVPDRRIARQCRALGAAPAAGLVELAGGARVLVYDPASPANLARLAALDAGLEAIAVGDGRAAAS